MFPPGEIKRNLLGTLEIALFMRAFRRRFGESKAEMWRSWLLPVATLPIAFAALPYMQAGDETLAPVSLPVLYALFSLKIVVVTALNLLVLWLFAKQYKREQHFLPLITASNWSSIIGAATDLPLLFTLVMHYHTWHEVEQAMIVFTIYGYCLLAFTITHILRIPWQMAGFLSICTFAVNQTAMQILYKVAEGVY